MKKVGPLRRIVCKRPRKVIRLADVVWVEAAGSYSLIHFKKGQVLKLSLCIAKVAELLPEFLRTHRRQLVNLVHIDQLERNPNIITLVTGQSLPIARRRWPDFHRTYLIYRSSLIHPRLKQRV